MFFIAEYANMVTISAMMATLFFGGWDIPFTKWDESGTVLAVVVSHLFFFAKVFFWIFLIMWLRWTLPRFRYDQLMALGWKFMLPVALAYIMVVAFVLWGTRQLGWTVPGAGLLALTAVSLVLGVLILVGLDRGAIVNGSDPRRRRLAAATARTQLAGSTSARGMD